MKEKKPVETPSRDSKFMEPEFAYNNMLALPQAIKNYLMSQGLDFRFLNAGQFRQAGGYHRSHWVPFNLNEHPEIKSVIGATPEGLIARGDLILGVRPKTISSKHREFLAEKNRRYSNFNQEEARKLREDARRKGLEGVKITEGYDDKEQGFN